MNNDVSRFTNDELIEAFEYLDELRESGRTNMFAAGNYVAAELEHTREDARALTSAWMRTFSHEKTIDQRIEAARSRPEEDNG